MKNDKVVCISVGREAANDIIEVLAKSHPAVCNALCGYSSDDLIPEGA